jgi:hypothetical protein
VSRNHKAAKLYATLATRSIQLCGLVVILLIHWILGEQKNIMPLNNSMQHFRLECNQNRNKKFWEELFSYFPLIRYGPHIKRRIQILFYCCVRVRCRNNVFTEPLPRNDRRIQIQTHRLMEGIYEVRLCSVVVIYMPRFIKIGSCNLKFMGGG